MNEEIKNKWQAALTSGEYEQGVGALRDRNNRYCCLGVLCDVYQKETGKGTWNQLGDGIHYFSIDEFDRSSHFLPSKVLEWAGLESNNPAITLPSESTTHSLAYLNDDQRLPFIRIAELIDSL